MLIDPISWEAQNSEGLQGHLVYPSRQFHGPGQFQESSVFCSNCLGRLFRYLKMYRSLHCLNIGGCQSRPFWQKSCDSHDSDQLEEVVWDLYRETVRKQL